MRFLVVYIAEAHASDEWPVGALTSVTTQPTHLQHRINLAQKVKSKLLHDEVDVVCDAMDNGFQQTMAAWPIRAYVVDPPQSGTVTLRWKAQPTLAPPKVYGYDLNAMTAWLESNIGGTQA